MKCSLVAVRINVNNEVCVLVVMKCYNIDVVMINDYHKRPLTDCNLVNDKLKRCL